jgi:hypothetical protein
MLLSFNYTNLVEKYKNSKIGTVTYIHGRLSESKSIIFGYGDEMDATYKDLLNNANNEYGAIGSIWNNELGCVEGVTSTRSKYAYFKELKGFAKGLNTIHGLILKINKILESGDIYTRDPNTVQGCINRLNDIFDKFNVLKPKHFLTIGNDG